jgi:hypothetical protein
LILAAILGSSVAGTAIGQVSDALRDRVDQLVEKLASEKQETRDQAEKSLIELGPKILPALPEAGKVGSEEAKKRLAKIREKLEAASEEMNLGASKVTLQAKGIRFTEAIQKLQAMSGNTIADLREQAGGEVTNPSIDLDIKNATFFEALDVICDKAGLTPNFFSGDGSIGLMAGMPSPGGKPMVVYSGPFRVQFKELAVTRDFLTGTGAANAQFEVAWEPRLRPMLLEIKSDGLTVVDDRGKNVPAMISEETDDTVLRPENPAAEVNINLQAPERAAKELTTLKVKGSVTVPAAQRLFKFAKLTAKNDARRQGDISVTLESTEVDEQVWKVAVTVAYPDGGPAFESYRQGLFNNRLWLQKSDGTKFEHNGGFNNTASDNGKLSFEYLFVDVPGKPADYGLVYETPSKVIPIPLEFEFKKVPLP